VRLLALRAWRLLTRTAWDRATIYGALMALRGVDSRLELLKRAYQTGHISRHELLQWGWAIGRKA